MIGQVELETRDTLTFNGPSRLCSQEEIEGTGHPLNLTSQILGVQYLIPYLLLGVPNLVPNPVFGRCLHGHRHRFNTFPANIPPRFGHGPAVEPRGLTSRPYARERAMRCLSWFSRALLGALLLGAVTAPAMAATLYGGGADVPAGPLFGYRFLAPPDPLHDRLTLPGYLQLNSFLGSWVNLALNQIQYCQVGSGAGKKILNGDTSYSPGGTCGDFDGLVPTTGLSIPSTAPVQPDFVVSGIPYSASEYATFVANKGATRGEPVQYPILMQSLAIVYNNNNVSSSNPINLTDAQVCNIFSGVIFNWNQLNPVYPPKPIKLVVRKDDSGATFSLMNHLSAVCGTIANSHFVTDQLFATATATLPIHASSTTMLETSEAELLRKVATNDGTIGYAGTATALQSPVGIADLNSLNPVSWVAPTYNAFQQLSLDKVLSGVDANGRPVVVSQTPNTVTGCLALIDPALYAAPTSGYALLDVTYLMAGQKGNGANQATLESLIRYPYANSAGVTTVGTDTSVAFIQNSGITSLRIHICTSV